MISKTHNYKVINQHGAIYVTYNEFDDAKQFVKNASKKINGRLRIEPNNTITKLQDKHQNPRV